jgi:hypothetical protein
MSPLPNFEDDLFISYAHIDNQPLAEGLRGWVETFHERLRIRLEQLTGETARIWRDRKLQGNDIFAETLVARLSKAAIMVAVISPRYVKSDWCLKELCEFCRSSEAVGGMTVGDKSRVFKVVKFHVPVTEHPPQLRGVLGYEFYEYDAERGRAREFSPDVTPARDIRYWERLDDIAYDIKQMLDAFAQTAAQSPREPRAGAAADAKTVYLSETTSDLSAERDLVKRELQLRGHLVLPDKELPLTGPELREAVGRYVARSSLSIHLLGGWYGIVPEGETRSLVEIQSELAEARGEGLRRIVWMPSALDPRDERQRELVNHFRLGLNGSRSVEVLQTSLEELKKHVEERLADRPKAAEADACADGGGPASVYLICDREDLPEVTPLEEYLFGRGFNVFLPATEGDESSVREDHKANLVECDAALVYYGRGGDVWLRMKQRELQKAAGYGRARPMLAKAIYIAGPPTPAKEHVRDHEALVIKCFDGFSPDALAPFVERVEKGVRG